MGDFLDKDEATIYFERKSPYFEELKEMKDRNIARIYPGKKFVLCTPQGEHRVKKRVIFEINPDVPAPSLFWEVSGIFTVHVIGMGRDGVYAIVKSHDGTTTMVGHVPVPLGKVFVSIPSRVKIERTIRRDFKGDYQESIAAGMLLKHKFSPMYNNPGQTQLLAMDDFFSKVGKERGAELLNQLRYS